MLSQPEGYEGDFASVISDQSESSNKSGSNYQSEVTSQR